MPDSKRQKILIITRNLPPLVGGMERLNWHMADELSKYADVRVIGPSGSAAQKPENVHISEAPLKPLPLFLITAFIKGLWTALRWRPDTILAGSGLTGPLTVILSWLCNAKSAVYLHGLDITVNSRSYQSIWLPIIRRSKTFIVNSTPTRDLAVTAGINLPKIYIVPPGVHIPQKSNAEQKSQFLTTNGLEGKRILLSVGRLTARKGLREFIQHALPLIVEKAPDVMLVVIGSAPSNALSTDAQTPESLLKSAAAAGVADNVKLLGSVTEQTLNTAFGCSTLHVFPIRHIPNDPEGFGMVAIEAAAHGVPTVAFATGGVVDAIENEISGALIKPDSYPEMAQAVLDVISGRKIISPAATMAFSRTFVWPNFGKKVRDALDGISNQT